MTRRIVGSLGLLACLLIISMPARATIQLDTSTSSHQEHGLGESLGIPLSTTQSNDVVLVWVLAYDVDGDDPGISVSGGGISWAKDYSVNVQAGYGVFYLFSGVASSPLDSAEITASTNTGDDIHISLIIDAYSGCNTSSPIDQVGSSVTGTSVSLTTGQANTLAVGAMYDRHDGEDYDAGTGYTLDTDSYVNFISGDRYGADEYADAETLDSDTQVTIGWTTRDSGYLTMIGATLVDGS